MKFSLYSFINSIFVSGLIFSVIFLIRKKHHFVHTFEVFMFSFLYLLAFVRLIIPADFSFTKGVSITGLFSDIFDILFISETDFLFVSMPAGFAFMLLICLISAEKLIQSIFLYHKERNMWETEKYPNPDVINKIHQKLQKKQIPIPVCSVVVCSEISVPMVMGILNPRVILPDIQYSHQELYYILLHEYSHINRKDLLKKAGIEMLLKLFWWIPISTFIRDDLQQSIEIKCDRHVLNTCTQTEQIAYARSLVQTLQHAKQAHCRTSERKALYFAVTDHCSDIIERFQIMTGTGKPSRKLFSTVLLTVMVFVASYFVVPVPQYEAPEEPGTYYATPQNTYITVTDGQYYGITDGKKAAISPAHAETMLNNGFPLKKED